MSIKLSILLISLFTLFYFVHSKNLQVGNSVNGQLEYVENVKLSSIPLTTRVKNVFYNGNKTIKGITAMDLDDSEAKVSITAGGVGFTFANIKLKSKKGNGLYYQVQIFV